MKNKESGDNPQRKEKTYCKSNTLGQLIHQLALYTCSSQTFGNTVKRVKRSLPNSPNKTAAVLKKLVLDLIGSEVLIKSPIHRMQHAKSLSEEEMSQVIDFYCRNGISRQAPGI